MVLWPVVLHLLLLLLLAPVHEAKEEKEAEDGDKIISREAAMTRVWKPLATSCPQGETTIMANQSMKPTHYGSLNMKLEIMANMQGMRVALTMLGSFSSQTIQIIVRQIAGEVPGLKGHF